MVPQGALKCGTAALGSPASENRLVLGPRRRRQRQPQQHSYRAQRADDHLRLSQGSAGYGSNDHGSRLD
jgi:hypothetical protein